jgi:Tol biopolymer transport system component
MTKHTPSRVRGAALALALSAAAVLAATLPAGAGEAKTARAAFSGLNGKIAFTRASIPDGGGEILAMNPDGTEQANLTQSDAYDHSPSWSPGGARVAFARCCPGNSEIFVMNADGSGQTNLTNDPAQDRGPAWSPDGTKIAFSRIGSDRAYDEIFVMNADGSGQTDLSKSPRTVDTDPAWSPDGTRIVFTRRTADNSEVFVMNADGSAQTNLTNTPSYVFEYSAAWSPDGSRIVFGKGSPNLNSQIFVMNADGSGQTNLTNDPGWGDYEPTWSPDATRIAFVRRDANTEDVFLMVMNADGSSQSRLTDSSYPVIDLEPDWQALLPPQCRVPKVVGKRLGTARTRIRRAHCSVGRVRRTRSRRVGRVIAQSPRAGVRRPRGARVNLVVGRR